MLVDVVAGPGGAGAGRLRGETQLLQQPDSSELQGRSPHTQLWPSGSRLVALVQGGGGDGEPHLFLR